MMTIIWGVTEDCCYYIDREFKREYDPSWFQDETVLAIIRDIDNAVFDNGVCRDVDDGYTFFVEGLSTGSKGLILLLKMDYDCIDIWGSAFGDNCAPWLLRIAEDRDFRLCLEHYMEFPEEQFKARSYHQNRDYTDYDDYRIEVGRYGFQSWAYEDFECEANVKSEL